MILHNLKVSALVLTLTWGAVLPTSQLGKPRNDYKASDFGKLRWIEGTWQGSGGGYDAFYERYRFLNDSTMEKMSFTDATFRMASERATIALRDGRIYDESGKTRYEAAKVTSGVAQFVPVRGASNSFQFTRMSRERWTATIYPAGGGKKKTVYEMKRIG